jgi:hypothetical protein
MTEIQLERIAHECAIKYCSPLLPKDCFSPSTLEDIKTLETVKIFITCYKAGFFGATLRAEKILVSAIEKHASSCCYQCADDLRRALKEWRGEK